MLTKNQINFLNRTCSDNWIEENDVIDVNVDVDIFNMNLTEIPVQFGRINGYFACYTNKLTSLKGAPFIINTHFDCDFNQLTSLEGGLKEISGFYSCSNNNLTSLIGAPEICNDTFWCRNNKLTSLEGCPNYIKGNLYCDNNPLLKYLWGIGRVERGVYYDNRNEINEWIIECMKRDIIFPYFTLEENINWIKREKNYFCLLGAPKEILQYFSPIILDLVNFGLYNESKIKNSLEYVN